MKNLGVLFALQYCLLTGFNTGTFHSCLHYDYYSNLIYSEKIICLAAYNNNSNVEYGCLCMQKEARFFVSITWRIVLRNLGEEGSLNPEL